MADTSGSPGRSSTRNRTQLPGHRSREMEENKKRVQRAKLEKRFLSDITQDRHKGSLNDYKALRQDAQTTGRISFDLKNPVQDHTRLMIESRKEREARARSRMPGYEPIRAVSEFAGSIRCLESAQGSSTLWTGDDDGTISIRNGRTGGIVHHIPGSGGLRVDSLFATDTHMWVGMNDGTLRIYDHLVYILVSEAKHHTDAITSFTSTFDGKVFSGGADGDVIKWDTEANNFEVMSRWNTEGLDQVRSLACYGYNLFVGSENARIFCLDTESGAVQKEFEGHTLRVTALLVQDGFLFSASADATLRAWDIEKGRCIFPLGSAESPPVEHASGITALVGDDVAHRIWSSDESGVVHVWESVPDDFKHLYELRDHAADGVPIVSLKNYATVDAVKMWSITSSGLNRVWHSSVNKGEDATSATIEAMESIISQDTVQLERWKDLVSKLEGIDAERKRKLAGILSLTTESDASKHFFLQWRKWLTFKQRADRQRRFAELIERNTTRGLTFVYFRKLQRFSDAGRALRQKHAVAKLLMSQTHRGLMLVYWNKVRAFAKHLLQRARQQRAAEALLSTTAAGTRRYAWKRLRRFHDEAARKKMRVVAAEALMKGTEKGTLRVFYLKWAHYGKWKRQQELRWTLFNCLELNTQNGTRRVAWLKLSHWARGAGRRRRRLVWADCLAHTNSNFLRRFCYNRLNDFRREHQLMKKRGELDEEGRRKLELKRMYDEKSVILKRVRTLEGKKQELADVKDRLEEIRADRRRREEQMEELRRILKERRDGHAERDAKAKQQWQSVGDFMAMLKAKVMNYHRDYQLIERTRDQVKPRGQLPVEKLFLESHMVVKRVVIDVTKEQIATGQEWTALPKGGKLDKAVPSHQKIVLLNAIKIMIICYELMSQEIRDRLTTDDEILANTEYLKDLAVCAKKEEDRRRGVKPFVTGSPSRSRSGSAAGAGGERRSSRSRSRSAGAAAAGGSQSRASRRSNSRGRDASSPTRESRGTASPPRGSRGSRRSTGRRSQGAVAASPDAVDAIYEGTGANTQ
eukprot:Hpha_TRINITY_DN16016_c1_g1::TRINITY_DN16016_c1_g1_i1::g.120891::m.120891